MSKKQQIGSVDLEKVIMTKIKSNQITMKPRWYFILGSISLIIGLASFSFLGIFLTNLTMFLSRQHGPMGQWRLYQILNTFPLWVPIFAVLGIIIGVFLLRKYDFSYKNNFYLIALGFIATIILTAYLLDYTGLNNVWMMRQPMRKFQQQKLDSQNFYQNGIRQERRFTK